MSEIGEAETQSSQESPEQAVQSEPEHEQEIVAWLKEHAHPLQSIDPESPLIDLESLKDMIGDARVVGMGEATHGNKEFTMIRHKMLRYMVENMGFNGLILETPAEQGERINNYVQGGQGNIQDILKQGAWVHNNQEMIDTIEWMREYNRNTPSNPIVFKGCDISIKELKEMKPGFEDRNKRDEKMAKNTLDIMDEHGDNAKFALWSHDYHISGMAHEKATAQGYHLRQLLGDKYRSFVTQCNQGTFTAIYDGEINQEQGEKYLRQFSVPQMQNSYGSTFAQTGYPYAFVDMRETLTDPIFADWRQETVNAWQEGASHDPTVSADQQYYPDDLSKMYDSLIFIDTVTASEPYNNF